MAPTDSKAPSLSEAVWEFFQCGVCHHTYAMIPQQFERPRDYVFDVSHARLVFLTPECVANHLRRVDSLSGRDAVVFETFRHSYH